MSLRSGLAVYVWDFTIQWRVLRFLCKRVFSDIFGPSVSSECSHANAPNTVKIEFRDFPVWDTNQSCPSRVDKEAALLGASFVVGRLKSGSRKAGYSHFVGWTGNRTVTQMRHPLLFEGLPNCARQSLARTLSALVVAATLYCQPGRHVNVAAPCLLTTCINLPCCQNWCREGAEQRMSFVRKCRAKKLLFDMDDDFQGEISTPPPAPPPPYFGHKEM